MDTNPYQPAAANLADSDGPTSGRLWNVLKKVLIGFGVLFALLLALVIWALVKTSNTSEKFVDVAEPFISGFLQSQSPWDYDTAKSDLSKLWLEGVDEAQSRNLFRYFNKLGAFTSLDSVEQAGCINAMQSKTPVERCNYKIKATYEHGEAVILMGLNLESEALKIMQLNVNSDVFMQ